MKTRIALVCLCALAFASGVARSQTTQPAAAPAALPSAQLSVVQDEGDVERAIAAYISDVHHINGELRELENAPGDIVVVYSLSPDNAPAIGAVVDTIVSNHNEQGQAVERRIRTRAYYLMPDAAKTPQMRARIMEINNSFMQEYWSPGRVFLDKDGDLCLETSINIPGPDVTVHAEQVYDAIVRMMMGWQELYPLLQKGLPAGMISAATSSPAQTTQPTESAPAQSAAPAPQAEQIGDAGVQQLLNEAQERAKGATGGQ